MAYTFDQLASMTREAIRRCIMGHATTTAADATSSLRQAIANKAAGKYTQALHQLAHSAEIATGEYGELTALILSTLASAGDPATDWHCGVAATRVACLRSVMGADWLARVAA